MSILAHVQNTDFFKNLVIRGVQRISLSLRYNVLCFGISVLDRVSKPKPNWSNMKKFDYLALLFKVNRFIYTCLCLKNILYPSSLVSSKKLLNALMSELKQGSHYLLKISQWNCQTYCLSLGVLVYMAYRSLGSTSITLTLAFTTTNRWKVYSVCKFVYESHFKCKNVLSSSMKNDAHEKMLWKLYIHKGPDHFLNTW